MGFDESQPTSESGGKPRALQRLIEEHKLQCVAMVGDGATDLEAAPPAHVFIGKRVQYVDFTPLLLSDTSNLTGILKAE